MSMFYYYDLDISEVFIFDEFVVNQIREGVSIVPEHSDRLAEILEKHFHRMPVVYISNRVFSYSVDPIAYLHASEIHNLLAIGIVAKTPEKRQVAAFEGNFYKKPFAVFEDLSDAISWSHKIVVAHEEDL